MPLFYFIAIYVKSCYTQIMYMSELTTKILEDFAVARFKSTQSFLVYKNIIEGLCSFCRKDFLSLNQPDVFNYFEYCENVKKNDENTLALKRRALLSFASFIEENRQAYHLLAYDYGAVFRILSFDSSEHINPDDIPAIEDVNKLFSYIKEKQNWLLLLASALALKCALSPQTILSITISDLCLATDGTRALRIKGKEEKFDRYIKLTDDLNKLFDLYTTEYTPFQKIKYNGNHPIFITNFGAPLSYRTLARYLSTASKEAGVNITFNKLKMLSISYLIKNGATDDDLTNLTGKKSAFNWRYNLAVSQLVNTASDYNFIELKL